MTQHKRNTFMKGLSMAGLLGLGLGVGGLDARANAPLGAPDGSTAEVGLEAGCGADDKGDKAASCGADKKKGDKEATCGEGTCG